MGSAVNHMALFEQFVRAEMATGGPDPQMPLIAAICHSSTPIEKVWLAGCYASHHAVGSAVAVWTKWRPQEVVDSPLNFSTWLWDAWESLPVRPEMRSHRMVEKRAQCLEDFAAYALGETWHPKHHGTYDDLWDDSIDSVKYFGRYMAIKYLDLLRRTVRPDITMPDMRARNAWSPRLVLSWLWPNEPGIGDRDDNTEATCARVDRVADVTRTVLASAGIHVNFFQLQVMLCEYREALNGTYYPGASHDEEMDYLAKMVAFPSEVNLVYNARKALFDPQYLGELNGWRGIRKECYKEFKGVTA